MKSRTGGSTTDWKLGSALRVNLLVGGCGGGTGGEQQKEESVVGRLFAYDRLTELLVLLVVVVSSQVVVRGRGGHRALPCC